MPVLETRGMREEVEVGLEASEPLFKLALLADWKNILADDNDVDAAEGSAVSGVLEKISASGTVPLSALSDLCTSGTESFATTGTEVKLHIEKKK